MLHLESLDLGALAFIQKSHMPSLLAEPKAGASLAAQYAVDIFALEKAQKESQGPEPGRILVLPFQNLFRGLVRKYPSFGKHFDEAQCFAPRLV